MCTRNTWLDEQVDEIVDRYIEQRQSMREIAEAFDVSPPTIRKRLIENDVPIRNGGGQYTLLTDQRDEIVSRYIERKDSPQSIAQAYGTSVNAIVRQLRAANVELQRSGPDPTDLGFAPYQVSVIKGELLGDGCLYEHDSGSCFFQLTNTVREHTLRVESKLPDGLFPDTNPYSVTRDTEFGAGEYTSWIISSRVQPIFEEIYSSWYENHGGNHRKIVPKEYSLDQTALLHWYWGDGNCTLRESGAPRVSFATHGFPAESVEHLQSELQRLGYESYTIQQEGVENGSGLFIRLSDIDARQFLDDLRPRNKLREYDYKFPVIVD